MSITLFFNSIVPPNISRIFDMSITLFFNSIVPPNISRIFYMSITLFFNSIVPPNISEYLKALKQNCQIYKIDRFQSFTALEKKLKFHINFDYKDNVPILAQNNKKR